SALQGSAMDSAREKRKEEISNALAFIQSPLAYPDPAAYQDFLTRLVCNLLEEGNAFFRDQQWEEAVREFSEALNVSSYAEADKIHIPQALLESLYVNRAAAYHSMYDEGVKDSNSALEVCSDSRRALYRKALCLKALGKHKEAYDCTTVCLLSNPQTVLFGLGLYLYDLFGIELDLVGTKPVCLVSVPKSTIPSTPPSSSRPAASAVPHRVEAVEDSEVLALSEPDNTPTSTPSLPAPTPQLPPAFFSSSISQLNSLDCFTNANHDSAAAALDILDDLYTSGDEGGANASNLLMPTTTLNNLDGLDSLDTLDDILDLMPNAVAAKETKTELKEGEKTLDELLNEVDTVGSVSHIKAQNGDVPKIATNSMKQLDSLDDLDSFPTLEIDVWTEERKRRLDRNSLFGASTVQLDPVSSIIGLLQEHKGMFIFLCQILEKRKCNYIGNCTFAHSQEEKEIWMYMKNNDLRDMQQVYDMWLTLAPQNRQTDGAMFSQPNPEEKFIAMPTDYAEPLRNACDTRIDSSCPDGVSCDYAHGPEELQEWIERRVFLRQKLAKAREDMLIMPDELDFGKYNFLLQD
ncbi:hypothetical protein GOODEAATRI_009685, partial [Goodea atripinnis]